MTRDQAFRFRKNHLTVVLILALFLVAACEIDDGSLDGGDGTAGTAQTVSPSDSDGEDAQIVEFSTWAEDAFEQDAYLEAVDLFTSETGVEVDLDMTVNEIALEQLGQ